MVVKSRVRKLVNALRSGKYHQTTKCLTDGKGKFCCLGVACQIAIKNGIKIKREGICYDGTSSILPKRVRNWFGFHKNDPVCSDVLGQTKTLVERNDGGESFRQIADAIEYTFLKGDEK